MDDPTTGNLTFSYLWFLIYLWVFSMILMPLFFYFRKESRKSLLSRLAGFMEKPGAIFLPAVPLIIINILLRPKYGWGNQNLIDDWANFLFYMLIVLYGFLIVSDSRNIQTTRRNSYPALGVAAICTLFIALNRLDIVGAPTPLNMTLYAVACWSWLIFIISIGSRLLNFTNPVRSYANDAVLPVYILHQSIIVVLAYFIIQWNTPVLLKYFLIGFTTLVSSLAIYEVVRRINVTRFLFGIKTRKKALGS